MLPVPHWSGAGPVAAVGKASGLEVAGVVDEARAIDVAAAHGWALFPVVAGAAALGPCPGAGGRQIFGRVQVGPARTDEHGAAKATGAVEAPRHEQITLGIGGNGPALTCSRYLATAAQGGAALGGGLGADCAGGDQ